MVLRRTCLALAFNLFFCMAIFPQNSASQSVSVDESKIAFRLLPDTEVEVPLVNRTGHPFQGSLVVEMLAWDSNRVVDQRSIDLQLAEGTHVQTLKWGREHLDTLPGLGAYRLRYTITSQPSGDFEPVQGIIQLGPHIVDGFSVQTYPAAEFRCAFDCRFLVRVAEPNSGHGLAGYAIEADIGPDPGTITTATTDKDGYAEIHHNFLPRDADYGGVGASVKASHGPFTAETDASFYCLRPPHLALTTDKSAYHPGETVHMHIFLTGTEGKPWSGGNISLKISKTGWNSELLLKELMTSTSGEGFADWTVPLNMEDVSLSILATSKDEPQKDWMAQGKVKITVEHAEEPTFTVSAEPDQHYYLPGQNAKITVRARDFSGKTIKDGAVRLQDGRNQEEAAHGKLDNSGTFFGFVSLQEIWDSMKESPELKWSGPQSYGYPVTVSVTDDSTGKTVSHSFDLRIAMQEIQLSVNDDAVAGSERTLGIVSSYGGKSPASVDGLAVAIAPDANGQCMPYRDRVHGVRLGRFHTNNFGVARVRLPRNWIDYAYPKREDGAYSWYAPEPGFDAPREQATKNVCILLRASDGRGKSGTSYKQVSVLPSTHFAVRISTDHSIYHPGDSLRVRIESDEGLTEALVEIRNPGMELAGAQHISLTNGNAEVTFPYSPQFLGLLTVDVFAVVATGHASPTGSSHRSIIYPTGEPLNASDRWPSDIWNPDEVEPDDRGSWVQILGEEDRGWIAGMQKKDLLSLDPAKPFPDGLDLVAWALLGPSYADMNWGDGGYDDFDFEKFDKENLAQIEPALKAIYSRVGQIPKTEKEMIVELKKAGIEFSAIRDGWGMPYRVVFGKSGVELVSNGPDKIPDTRDDYVAMKIH